MSRESKLLIYALLGDSFALNRLLLFHSEAVSQYIRTHTPSDLKGKLSHETILFHTFARASASLPHLPAVDTDFFHRWLLSITRESLVSTVRSYRKGYLKGTHEPHGSKVSVSMSTKQRRNLSKLVFAIDELPSDVKRILKLRYFQGQSDNQIATNCELPRERVQELCDHGMELLRGDLGSGVAMLTH